MTLSSLELWRLSDELSVTDAAILISGNNPSEKIMRYDENGQGVRDSNGVCEEYQRTDYDGFDPVFKALRTAIFSNKLKAILGAKARKPSLNYGTYGNPEMLYGEGEIEFSFDVLIRASGYSASIYTNRRIDNLSNASKVYVLDQPDWTETMINVDDLKDWLDGRGLYPDFFFPEGKAEGFRDKAHPRYSAKLACAVAAWEAIERQQPNKSVKETITAWVHSNAVSFGMAEGVGIVPKLSVEDVAKVVNWAIMGGAPPTNIETEAKVEKAEVNNFSMEDDPDPKPDFPF